MNGCKSEDLQPFMFFVSDIIVYLDLCVEIQSIVALF